MKTYILFMLFISGFLSLNAQVFTLQKYVMGSSISAPRNQNYHFFGTAGQFVAGLEENVDYKLISGFWPANLISTDADFYQKPEVTGNNSFLIYPNPASDFIEIVGFNQNEKSILEKANIRIYNSLGQCLITMGPVLPGCSKINIDHLPAGMYIVMIENSIERFFVVKRP